MTQHIGPYEIRGELGRGAMAVVWRAFDTKLEREVALKEAHFPHGIDEATKAELSARFIREGKTAGKLNHPGIVTVYSADIYEGRPVIAMELIEGETLAEALQRTRLSQEAALNVAAQLLDAVAYAHDCGVVHRDIKPDNVFITDDGRVKLTDFGIAHVGAGTQLTQAGTVMGTPGYMAPEQIRGEATDARVDLFAVGVMLYEMLAGSNPWFGEGQSDSTSLMYRVVHEDPRPLPDSVPPQVVRPVLVAMNKQPEKRFQSAAEMLAAITGSGTSRPVTNMSTKPDRHRRAYVVAAVACLAAAATFIWSLGGFVRNEVPDGELLQTTTQSVPATATQASGGSSGSPAEDPVDIVTEAAGIVEQERESAAEHWNQLPVDYRSPSTESPFAMANRFSLNEGSLRRARDLAQSVATSDETHIARAAMVVVREADLLLGIEDLWRDQARGEITSTLLRARYLSWASSKLLAEDPEGIAMADVMEEAAMTSREVFGMDFWILVLDDFGQPTVEFKEDWGYYMVRWEYADDFVLCGGEPDSSELDRHLRADGEDWFGWVGMGPVEAGGIRMIHSAGNVGDGVSWYDQAVCGESGLPPATESAHSYSISADSASFWDSSGLDGYGQLVDRFAAIVDVDYRD